jgi:hypothetical protein
MSGTVDASRFKKVPLSEITSPEKAGPLWTFKDHWWSVTEDRCVLIYTHRGANSPQCNQNRAIAERILCPSIPTTPQLLPWAYLQFSISEYA